MGEQTFLGSNINLVKAHNLQTVLLSLLYETPQSRVELAQKTGLSTTTITNLVAELLEQGVVAEVEGPSLDEPRPVGRPRTALRLVPDARFAVGVHIGVGLFRVAVVDLCADMVHNRVQYFELDSPPEAVLESIVIQVQQVIEASGVARERILGVGVGASGLVDHRTGVNVLAPNLGWHNLPLRSFLQQRLDIPLILENNVRAMALGEAYFGQGRGVDSLAFVYGRTGVGSGLVLGGQVLRGTSAGAGEIGHMIMIPHGGEPCRCGRSGCLETLVSETVLLREAEALARRDPQGILAAELARPQSATPIERVFAAVRQGDTATRKLIEERAAYLGIALANLVNVVNPELILLGGMFAQAQDLFLPVAAETMRSWAFAGLGEQVRLQATAFGWRAGVTGAAALALLQYFYHPTDSSHVF